MLSFPRCIVSTRSCKGIPVASNPTPPNKHQPIDDSMFPKSTPSQKAQSPTAKKSSNTHPPNSK